MMAAMIARSAWTGLAKTFFWFKLTSNSSLAPSPSRTFIRTLRTGFIERAKDGADEHDDHERLKNVPETITVHFVTKDGVRKTVKAKESERVLYLAHRHGIEMEGACEASLACTTCHCYIEVVFARFAKRIFTFSTFLKEEYSVSRTPCPMEF